MVTWPQSKGRCQLGSWPVTPYSEVKAWVAKAEIQVPAWGAPGASTNLSEVKPALIRWFGALSLALGLVRYPSISSHCPIWFREPSPRPTGATTVYSGIVEHCFSQVVTLWIFSFVKWYVPCWKTSLGPLCTLTCTHHTHPGLIILSPRHNKASGSGAQSGAQGIVK